MNIENAWNVRPKPHIEDKQTSPIQITLVSLALLNLLRPIIGDKS